MTAHAARSTRICLVTFGSAGDVHPMLALGRELRARAWPVTLLSNPAFAQVAAASGLAFEPVGDETDYHTTIDHPKLWHPIDGFGVMWRYLLRPALAPTYERIAQIAAAGPCIVIANPMAMGARVAQEALGTPLITAYTAATMLRTVSNPMTMASWRVPAWWPTLLRRTAWAALDRLKLEPLVRPALEALRGPLNLPPIGAPVFGTWMHSPAAGVALFPAWFAPARLDWPPQVAQAGFPLYADDTAQAQPPELEAFLEQGRPPVVFMPGTAQQRGDAFYSAAVHACMLTGQRGLLLGAVPNEIARNLPRELKAMPYAPFSTLLPRVRALVHHGGIGTTAQALKAGLPQLIVPSAYDQFDNAMRIERLGVGLSLSHRPGGLATMGARLGQLLHDRAIASASAHWARQTDAQIAHDTVAGLVERFA
jgi:rhamnosyltransferase subunit B